MKRTLLAASLLLAPAIVHAAKLVTLTGTYATDAPTTAYSAPGATFIYQFTAPDNFQYPTLQEHKGFGYTNASYLLNGMALETGATGGYTFYGYDSFYDPVLSMNLYFNGGSLPVTKTGTTSDPSVYLASLIPGKYSYTSSVLFPNTAQPSSAGPVTATVTPLPVGVTFDLSGTYPANESVSAFTAPNASFLLEFTVPRSVPANAWNSPAAFQSPILAGSYSFEGHTYAAGSASYYARYDSAGNVETIVLNTPSGTIRVSSIPPYHKPILSTRTAHTATAIFLTGNLGAGSQWIASFIPPKGSVAKVSLAVDISEVVSRLTSP